MATYVFSDIHGHRAPFERALERIELKSDDQIFCLGDMIDRGPDPVGVMRLVKSLDNCTVLLGNHEEMMLQFFAEPKDDMTMVNWSINGGMKTAQGLIDLGGAEADELIDWVSHLPLWAHTKVNDRDYLFVHAGIDPKRVRRPEIINEESIAEMMSHQSTEDLLWIRESFWSYPTGLINDKGEGIIVVAGHTPTCYLEDYSAHIDRPTRDETGLCRMVKLGASDATGLVPDRWDIDCGCAGGAGFGQVLILRLDDGKEFLEPVLKGE